jgi:hypothetical protein
MTFMVREYLGSEVYLLDQEGHLIEEPLCRREDLRAGMEVAVPSLFGGYCKMRVEESIPDKERYAEDVHNVAVLEFDIDDRHCWTSSVMYNKAVLRVLKETT